MQFVYLTIYFYQRRNCIQGYLYLKKKLISSSCQQLNYKTILIRYDYVVRYLHFTVTPNIPLPFLVLPLIDCKDNH